MTLHFGDVITTYTFYDFIGHLTFPITKGICDKRFKSNEHTFFGGGGGGGGGVEVTSVAHMLFTGKGCGMSSFPARPHLACILLQYNMHNSCWGWFWTEASMEEPSLAQQTHQYVITMATLPG